MRAQNPMTTEEVHAKIIGRRIVAITGGGTWNAQYGWLDEPQFVLDNGLVLNPQGEPIAVEVQNEAGDRIPLA